MAEITAVRAQYDPNEHVTNIDETKLMEVSGVLVEYKADNLIAIKTDEKFSFVILEKSDITCWNRFLRIFNCGKLANLDWKLENVAKRLGDYHWGFEAHRDVRFSIIDAAVEKVCLFAYKAYKRKPTQATEELTTRIAQYFIERSVHIKDSDIALSLKWTPYLTVEALQTQIEHQIRKWEKNGVPILGKQEARSGNKPSTISIALNGIRCDASRKLTLDEMMSENLHISVESV